MAEGPPKGRTVVMAFGTHEQKGRVCEDPALNFLRKNIIQGNFIMVRPRISLCFPRRLWRFFKLPDLGVAPKAGNQAQKSHKNI